MGVTQIELTEEEERELRRLAEKERASVDAMAHRLFREAIQRKADADADRIRLLEEWRRVRSLDRDELVRRFLAGGGTFHSGLHDVSERHDDYLEEIYRS